MDLWKKTLKILKTAEYDNIKPEYNNEFFIANKHVDKTIESEILDQNGLLLYKATGTITHIWNNYFSVITNKGEKLICLDSPKIITAYKFIPSQEPKIPCRTEVYRQYIDEKGNILFPQLEFRRAYGFYENRSVNINLDWDYEIIDGNGNYIFGKDFLELGQHYSEGLLFARDKKGQSGFVDYDGTFKFLIPLLNNNEDIVIATHFYKGKAIVNTVDKGICLIDKAGNIIKEKIPVTWFYDFCEDYAIVTRSNNSCNFLSLNGDFLLKEDADNIKDFCNGYAIISIHDKDALVDKNGQIIYMNN